MKKNMGSTDRIIRFLVAAVIVVLYLTNVISGTWAIILGALAAIFVMTSCVGSCPLYRPFRINTSRQAEDRRAI
jgi:O-antigen/teichoic acid export membrane protein